MNIPEMIPHVRRMSLGMDLQVFHMVAAMVQVDLEKWRAWENIHDEQVGENVLIREFARSVEKSRTKCGHVVTNTV
jgi:hypothetical protein